MRKAITAGLAAAAISSAGCTNGRVESAGPIVDRDYPVTAFEGMEPGFKQVSL